MTIKNIKKKQFTCEKKLRDFTVIILVPFSKIQNNTSLKNVAAEMLPLVSLLATPYKWLYDAIYHV